MRVLMLVLLLASTCDGGPMPGECRWEQGGTVLHCMEPVRPCEDYAIDGGLVMPEKARCKL